MTSPEKVITREVSALLSLLAEFCSDDPRRAALAFAHIDAEGKTLAATDGHRVVEVSLENALQTDVLGSALDCAKALARLKAGLLPERSSLPEGYTFPEYQQVIPAKLDTHEQAEEKPRPLAFGTFDPALLGSSLAAIAKCQKAHHGRQQAVRLQLSSDGLAPARLDGDWYSTAFGRVTVRAAVMPMCARVSQ